MSRLTKNPASLSCLSEPGTHLVLPPWEAFPASCCKLSRCRNRDVAPRYPTSSKLVAQAAMCLRMTCLGSMPYRLSALKKSAPAASSSSQVKFQTECVSTSPWKSLYIYISREISGLRTPLLGYATIIGRLIQGVPHGTSGESF